MEGGENPAGCDSKGLPQGLNIGVAHIFQEKREEGPTQTPLCVGEAQAGASQTHSRTWC